MTLNVLSNIRQMAALACAEAALHGGLKNTESIADGPVATPSEAPTIRNRPGVLVMEACVLRLKDHERSRLFNCYRKLQAERLAAHVTDDAGVPMKAETVPGTCRADGLNLYCQIRAIVAPRHQLGSHGIADAAIIRRSEIVEAAKRTGDSSDYVERLCEQQGLLVVEDAEADTLIAAGRIAAEVKVGNHRTGFARVTPLPEDTDAPAAGDQPTTTEG